MENRTKYSRNFRLLILCIGIIAAGCTPHKYSDERFIGEGFRTFTPSMQTQVVVGGNRYEAVNQAIHWLNDNKFLVVHRWVTDETNGKDPSFKANKRAQLLFLAHKVRAPLAIFIQVQKKPFKPNVDFSSVHTQQPKIIEIEIRGLNVETAEIVFEAKAWNSEPLVESQQLLQELTTFALYKALKDSQTTLPSRPAMHQDQGIREQATVYPIPQQEEISEETIAPSSAEDRSITSLHKSDGSPHHDSRKKTEEGPDTLLAKAPDETTTNAELRQSQHDKPDDGMPSENSSLRLQIASGALSVLYLPFKATYAVLGGFFGGFAYALTAGDETVADSIWNASLGGTYWLTPQHLGGDRPVYFMGQSDNEEGSP